jgi:hypothetical protein
MHSLHAKADYKIIIDRKQLESLPGKRENHGSERSKHSLSKGVGSQKSESRSGGQYAEFEGPQFSFEAFVRFGAFHDGY